MKAIIQHGYGSADILHCEEIAIPAVQDHEVLIKVRAASVNPLDWRLMRGQPYFLRLTMGSEKAKRVGRDVAGVVERCGKNVTHLKPGDEVFGVAAGAFAEYACGSEAKLATKPRSTSFEEVASVPIAGLTALQGLRDMGEVRSGQKVLINGAAGGVGTFAVQIAKVLGADVAGVCSTRNVEMVLGLGADRVIDYTREDFTKRAERYDAILDNVGTHSLRACRRVLKPGGRLVMVGAKHVALLLARALQARVLSFFVGQKLGFLVAKINTKDLAFLGELMDAGEIRAVIDRRHKLSEVSQALAYLEEGHARGKVVITVE